jgi:hypothetical protein
VQQSEGGAGGGTMWSQSITIRMSFSGTSPAPHAHLPESRHPLKGFLHEHNKGARVHIATREQNSCLQNHAALVSWGPLRGCCASSCNVRIAFELSSFTPALGACMCAQEWERGKVGRL